MDPYHHFAGPMDDSGPSRSRKSSLNGNSVPSAVPAMAFEESGEDQFAVDVIPSRAGRKLCVRHKQMANQDVNKKLQKVGLGHLSRLDAIAYS